MSRICVKNLPKYMAEDRLRDFFSKKGEITDAKLMRTKDGKSRQFAFIGFRTEEEADEAVKYFNKSYLDTCRITCEIAHKVGDPSMPRPWSRYSLKKEKEVTEVEKNPVGANRGVKKSIEMGSENDDPKLKDFLQVMQPRVKSKMWANDTLIGSTADQKAKITDNKTQAIKENREKPLAFSAHSDKTKLISDIQATEKPQNDAGDEVISDMDYFKSRVKTDWSDSEGEDAANEAGEEDNDHSGDTLDEERQDIVEDSTRSRVGEEYDDGETVDPGSPPSCSKVEHEEILESGRLFVRNLPYTTTEDELLEHFSRFGNVTEVHIVVDKETKRSKGIAYVLYTMPESASRAIEEVDNSIFQGRLLHVMPARQKKSSDRQEMQGQVSKTLKQRREEERKASEASGNTNAWNSLFMRPDTVVENIARKHGVRKSELLDREANDLAVRIALGETQVIAETKKALTNAGVNVTLLEEFAAGKCDGKKRSNHIFLVKNLPYDSMESELAKMFGKFGNLDKVVLPSTKTLAIVIFLEPAEAAAAFKGLAYKRYKGVPLYLEWAPNDLLSQNSTSKDNGKNDTSVGDLNARALIEQQLQGTADDDIDPDRVESRSLFVKNLNFKTSDGNLRNHFSEHMKEGGIISVKVKKHLKNGKNVSMGFGFIEFDSVDTATNICRDLQGTILDGHALVLQLCHTKKNDQVMKKAEKDKSSTKLLVRNVAFEATEKDLRQLFSPFGQIKSLRLPMKFGNHRGFAFVEYVTKQEAQNALEALSSTHLYGRHLVLERAKEGESLEELRARTTAQFSDELSGFQNQAKLSKKRKHMAILDEGKMKFERTAE